MAITLGIQTMPYIVAPSLLAAMPYDTEKKTWRP
jgi:hypothetical protein